MTETTSFIKKAFQLEDKFILEMNHASYYNFIVASEVLVHEIKSSVRGMESVYW